MSIESLRALFLDQIADLYDAEQQLVRALPKMAEAASADSLREAFTTHLRETEEHVARLERVFASVDAKQYREHCPAMEGLITEGAEIINMRGSAAVKDVALVAAAQRVEHYELAGYGNARALAEQLGYDTAAKLLDATLTEEGKANEHLTRIAQRGLLNDAQAA